MKIIVVSLLCLLLYFLDGRSVVLTAFVLMTSDSWIRRIRENATEDNTSYLFGKARQKYKEMTNPGEIFCYAREKEISIHGG